MTNWLSDRMKDPEFKRMYEEELVREAHLTKYVCPDCGSSMPPAKVGSQIFCIRTGKTRKVQG